MNILIKGYYGQNNLGDDYLLYSILDSLNNCGKHRVRVVVAQKQYKQFFEKFSNLSISEVNMPWRRLTKRYQLMRSDFWIIGGGGLFPKENPNTLNTLLSEIKFAKRFGCKVIFYGIDINSVNGLDYRRIWQEILEHTDLFIVRNRKTKEILDKIVGNKVIRGSDITFALETEAERKNDSSILDRLNLVKSQYVIWAIPNEFKKDVDTQRYRKLIDSLQKLANESVLKDYTHVLLPFNGNKDTYLLKALKEMIAGNCMLCDENIDIDDKRLLYKYAKTSVSMRFHSVMFSIYNELPGLFLSYSDKTSDVIKEFGLDEYLLEYGISAEEDFQKEFDFQENALLELANSVMAKIDDREKVIKASNMLKSMAKEVRLVFEDYIIKTIYEIERRN